MRCLPVIAAITLWAGLSFLARPAGAAEAFELHWQRVVATDFTSKQIRGLKRIDVFPDGGIVGVGWWDWGGKFDKTNWVIWVVSLDADGKRLWEETFHRGPPGEGTAVAALSDGAVAVAGTVYRKGSPSDLRVLRLDKAGNVVWQKTLGGTGEDFAADVTALPGGGLALAGTTSSKGAGGSDFWILRFAPDGTLVWERTFGGGRDDRARTITALADGRLLVTGAAALRQGKGGYTALMLDAQGNRLWDRVLTPVWWPNEVLAIPGGGYLIVDDRPDTTGRASEPDIHVTRLTGDGELLWQRSFAIRAEEDDRREVPLSQTRTVMLPDGGFVIGWLQHLKRGRPVVSGSQTDRLWLLKMDANGEEIWRRGIAVAPAGENVATTFWDMKTLPDGRVALTGQSWYGWGKEGWRQDVWIYVGRVQ